MLDGGCRSLCLGDVGAEAHLPAALTFQPRHALASSSPALLLLFFFVVAAFILLLLFFFFFAWGGLVNLSDGRALSNSITLACQTTDNRNE